MIEQLYYKTSSLSSRKIRKREKNMTERDTILDLERHALNTRNLVDRINKAMYGMTWEEHERLHGNKETKEAKDEK